MSSMEPPAGGSSLTPHPRELDWANLPLPSTWPDLNRSSPSSLVRLILHPLRRRRRVSIPADLWGKETIPGYVLQEFHNLPNGNYSNFLTRGYLSGFDLSMLGCMHKVRSTLASHLRHCESVLDLGCGGGATAAATKAIGVADTWGLDPSPYLLRHAARDHPGIRFVHGVMEDLPFPEARFDGVSVCFAFHEMPPARVREALEEISRVLKPGGLLLVAEPSPVQFESSFVNLVRSHGWRGGYFFLLARLVHEPYLEKWHGFSLVAEAREAALNVVTETVDFPVKWWRFERASDRGLEANE
ncbi:MAG: class I SAM-dependent methyltransferase [Candidatus Binatia bacterium]